MFHSSHGQLDFKTRIDSLFTATTNYQGKNVRYQLPMLKMVNERMQRKLLPAPNALKVFPVAGADQVMVQSSYRQSDFKTRNDSLFNAHTNYQGKNIRYRLPLLNVANERLQRKLFPSSDDAMNALLMTGADQVKEYLPLLKNKRVGLLINQTSVIRNRSLLDSLISLGVDIKMVLGPEHGFRSNASNGAHVANEVDEKTGITIISLYGKKRKPSKAEMDSLDVIIFDIQDVGCRFYTYINKLCDIMEACAEFDKALIILDRPNPNGYVDGPVLDMKLKSGIGKFPIPIVHGMTIGEFAKMINGEGWLPNGKQCNIKIIPMKNYSHDMDYTLPVKASPNLNTQQSVLLYPSLCLFEGTAISQGRGTYMPFSVLGSPDLKGKFEFTFTPKSIAGMSETPLYQDQVCYGIDLRAYDTRLLHDSLNLTWLMDMYRVYPYKESFFDSSTSKQIGDFDRLAGTAELKQQIIRGASEKEIRASWEPALSNYKVMRKKYLLYP